MKQNSVIPTCQVLLQAIGVLDQAYRGRHQPQASKVLYIVGKDNKYRKLATALKFKGYSVTSDSVFTEVGNRSLFSLFYS